MLNRLLEILQDGGSHRVSNIARELGTTTELVEAMIENLTRMGHLKQVIGGCGEACTSCSLTGTCTSDASGRVWTLTEEQ
jgi:hypothetical protein